MQNNTAQQENLNKLSKAELVNIVNKGNKIVNDLYKQIDTIEKQLPTPLTDDDKLKLVDDLTGFNNGTNKGLTVGSYIKAIQLLSDEDKRKQPLVKLNPVNMVVTKQGQRSSTYKGLTPNQEKIVNYFKQVNQPQTKDEVAKGLQEENTGKILATLQQMRNTNRPEDERTSMLIYIEPDGKITHKFYITSMINDSIRGEASMITTS